MGINVWRGIKAAEARWVYVEILAEPVGKLLKHLLEEKRWLTRAMPTMKV